MSIKILLYVIMVPLCIYALDSININNLFKKNRIYQARFLYLIVSFSLAYLFTNFLYDFFLNFQIIK